MIYLDNSATTRPCREAVSAMVEALEQNWGNPSALYDFGIEAARLLRAAKQLLADEELSISQVSQELGFEYPQHFVRFFKSQTGKTPSEYRRSA